jgi:hypothetical protein
LSPMALTVLKMTQFHVLQKQVYALLLTPHKLFH